MTWRRTLARARRAFTLIEILISILILALGVLGLGALFPVIIREQRIGADAVTGVVVSNNARGILSAANWSSALIGAGGNLHPRRGDPSFMYKVMRNSLRYDPAQPYPVQIGLGHGYDPDATAWSTLHKYAQGEWYVNTVDLATGEAILGLAAPFDFWLESNSPGTVQLGAPSFVQPSFVRIPVSQRLYPMAERVAPQFVWDFAIQRVSDFDYTNSPDADALRAVVIVRRIDPRIRSGDALYKAFTNPTNPSDAALPVAENQPNADGLTGVPTLDGKGSRYSFIKTCEVEFWYTPTTPARAHRDRLYFPAQLVRTAATPNDMKVRFAQMKQPGQKLVDNLGNIYTVVGSGSESSIPSADIDGDGTVGDYLRIDPPVPEIVTDKRAAPLARETSYSGSSGFTPRAIWQVAYTPQIPVSVTLVELQRGSR